MIAVASSTIRPPEAITGMPRLLHGRLGEHGQAAQSAGVGDGHHQLGATHPLHAALNDGCSMPNVSVKRVRSTEQVLLAAVLTIARLITARSLRR
jgi:hypothetical protein